MHVYPKHCFNLKSMLLSIMLATFHRNAVIDPVNILGFKDIVMKKSLTSVAQKL